MNPADAPFSRVPFPELFFGFVAPIGVDLKECIAAFTAFFTSVGYNVVPIKVTEIFPVLAKKLAPETPLVPSPQHERLSSYIQYGNRLRNYFDDDQILATLSIVRIMAERLRQPKNSPTPEKNVYLLYQFKRKEEIDLFRSVYGRCFFQVSVYSRRGARVDYLATSFARGAHSAQANAFRGSAEEIVTVDENEKGNSHGQRVSTIFHDADVIINSDSVDESLPDQVERFCELLFGSNRISPTKIEYGMFAAKAAALRTLDLARQVGAAIFSPEGEIITMGSNEVPKAGGGTYWCDDPKKHDDREYVREHDSNDRRKRELLAELLELLPIEDENRWMADDKIRESQFMDALEYGRIVHAEMSVISDAARHGRAIKDATMFVTTFPCHMCSKHIVAAGLKKVIFLEPYPKSLTSEMHSDSVAIEGADRGKFQQYPCVEFTHFHGVSPRRYRELFERGRRKDKVGNYQNYINNQKQPIIDLKFPFYTELEKRVAETAKTYLGKLDISLSDLVVQK